MADNPIAPLRSSTEVRGVEKQRVHAAESALVSEEVEQVSTERNFEEWCEEGFNPVAMTRRFQTLEEQQKTKRREKAESSKMDRGEGTERFEVAQAAATSQRLQPFNAGDHLVGNQNVAQFPAEALAALDHYAVHDDAAAVTGP